MSTEERSLTAWQQLREHRDVTSYSFLQVDDPPSRYDELRKVLIGERLKQYRAAGGDAPVESLPLHSSHEIIITYLQRLIGTSTNLLVDISTFPKRFFFPLIRLAYESSSIENLLVSYTVPSHYSDGELAEDPASWSALPTFLGDLDVSPDLFVIAVGFQLGGLSHLLQSFAPSDARFLLPVQSHPNGFKRSWTVVQELQAQLRTVVEPIRVDTWDASAVYDYIVSVSTRGARRVVLVPYGPKPISLAMCLFGIVSGAPAYYAQPRIYNPMYSHGVRTESGAPVCYMYALKIDSRRLYGL